MYLLSSAASALCQKGLKWMESLNVGIRFEYHELVGEKG